MTMDSIICIEVGLICGMKMTRNEKWKWKMKMEMGNKHVNEPLAFICGL